MIDRSSLADHDFAWQGKAEENKNRGMIHGEQLLIAMGGPVFKAPGNSRPP